MTAGPPLKKAWHQLMSVERNGRRHPAPPLLMREYANLRRQGAVVREEAGKGRWAKGRCKPCSVAREAAEEGAALTQQVHVHHIGLELAPRVNDAAHQALLDPDEAVSREPRRRRRDWRMRHVQLRRESARRVDDALRGRGEVDGAEAILGDQPPG